MFTTEIASVDRDRPLGLSALPAGGYDDYGIVLTCLPILIGVITAIENRFRSMQKFRVLRWASDALRSEIFKWRSNCGDFGSSSLSERNKLLRKRITAIADVVFSTVVIEGALRDTAARKARERSYRVDGVDDDCFSLITPDEFVQLRVVPEMEAYRQRAQAAQSALSRLQILVYLIGGLGTLLATFKLQILVAITTAVTTALNTLIEKEQYGEAVQVFNQAVTELTNVQGWWGALSAVRATGQSAAALVFC